MAAQEKNEDEETVDKRTRDRDRVDAAVYDDPSIGEAQFTVEEGRQEEEGNLRDPEGAEENDDGEDSDDGSVHSPIAVSLHKIEAKIGETVSEIGKKMGQIGEKVVEIETRLGEKVGELEAKIERKVEITKTNIEKIAHWAWKSLPFDNLPHWMQDNAFLTDAHRPPMYSFTGCFKSMFRMHTETWNIWTHFLGFIFFVMLCLGIYVYGDYITFLFEDIEVNKLPATEQAMLLCFFLGAMVCLSCSTLFHLFSNHSQGVYRIFIRMDYTGIAILITGSSIPAYYYGLYCSLVAQSAHIGVISILCVACVILSFWKKFGLPKYRPLRFATFVLFGFYGFIPGIHVALREGFNQQHVVQALIGLLVMGGVYILGGLLYVFRIPERFFPGKFNTWASSHQLFHICVVCAALIHYNTLLSMIKYRMSTQTCGMESISLPTLEVPIV